MDIDRSYQGEEVLAVKRELTNLARQNRPRSVVMQSPTGTGKGHTSVKIIKDTKAAGKSALFLVSGREIVKDFGSRLIKSDVEHEVMMNGTPYYGITDVNVCSMHTLQSWVYRKEKIPKPKADVVIVDECRLSCSAEFSHIVKDYIDSGSWVIGMDATPKAKGIGLLYESICQGRSIPWHIANGSLCDIRHFSPGNKDLQLVKDLESGKRNEQTGEIIEKDQESAFNKKVVIGDVYLNWKRLCSKPDGNMMKSVFYNVNQQHAWDVFKFFEGKGEKVAYMDAETSSEKRDQITEGIKIGEIDGVMNISVLGYGYDNPALQAAIANCSVKSVPRYLQLGGRVARPYEDKPYSLFIDHGGAYDALGPISQEWQWDLTDIDPSIIMQNRKRKNKEFKEIVCYQCAFGFSGTRKCPNCGHIMIHQSNPVPVWVFDTYLEEQTESQEKKEKEDSIAVKKKFMAEVKQYGIERVQQRKWPADKVAKFMKGIYRQKYGKWPQNNLLNVDALKTTLATQKYIRYYQIKMARRFAKN